MSSPPLPSAPLAERLAWLAAEARAEKEEAGRIAALFIEAFARLLSCLAGFAARLAAGALPRPEPRATTATPTTPAAAPVAPGLLPRVLGWFGGLLPLGGPISLPRYAALPRAEQPRTRNVSPWVPVQPHAWTVADASDDLRADDAVEDVAAFEAGWRWVHVPPFALAAPDWAVARLAAWRRLPAATAGPNFQIAEFRARSSTTISLRYRNKWPINRGGSRACVHSEAVGRQPRWI